MGGTQLPDDKIVVERAKDQFNRDTLVGHYEVVNVGRYDKVLGQLASDRTVFLKDIKRPLLDLMKLSSGHDPWLHHDLVRFYESYELAGIRG